jgi:hypothetical protein
MTDRSTIFCSSRIFPGQQTQDNLQPNGNTIGYTATAGTLVRPVTFAFNGGPGSSIWLHMGALGPERVTLGRNGEQLPPPYRLVDNQDSLLEFTDLVFIDPVTTGYGHLFEWNYFGFFGLEFRNDLVQSRQ